ncbi:hypothetical protein [Paenibacillus durus]|uniref:hypothetical protein n=1 Tax=Paenibacillus durus TaxID=44251 RepID=UPI000A7B3395|nr:hypothetical protein [Paenibacillus durus]
MYFPSGTEKQAIAINSVRGGSEEMKSRTVFQKPTTKVFEMPGAAKMQLGDDGVLFEKGTVSLHLDGGNITVNASEDLLLVVGNRMELGSGSEKGVLESIRMRAAQQIALQTNAAHYMVIQENRVGIKSSKLDFQKVEADFMELLTDEELKQMYIDEQAEAKIWQEELDFNKNIPVPMSGVPVTVPLPEGHKSDIRAKVAAEVNSNPNGVDTARSWLSGKSAEEQQNAYQKSYVPPAEPKKSKKEKQAELAERQKEYEQEDQDRTAVYEWNQSAKKIMEQGAQEGKSPAEIRAMLPPQPALTPRAPQESHWPGMIQKMLDFTGIGKMMEKMGPALDAWQLEHVIPQKPDYLSKHTEKKVYLSRYTFQVLVIDPQVLIAEINLLFGAVAIIGAFWTGGGSLYLLALADGVIGAGMVAVNIEKLIDLKNGNGNTNPNLLGIDQAMLDKMGLAIAFVNLAFLMKHGLYKAADKLANGRNIAALEELEDALKAGGTGEGVIGKTGEGIPIEEVRPDILEQIYRDDAGVYGYLPKERTPYAKYDFTDVEKVKQNRAIREEYLQQSKKIQEEIDRMVQQGTPIDEIANRVVNMRNQDKVSARAKMAPEELAPIEERNMKLYGNPIGPDAKWLFDSKKQKMLEQGLNPTDYEIWQSIIKSSMKKDDVLNTLLGLKH